MLQTNNDNGKLDAIERIRSALKDVSGESISVPGIVVVGAQSSGKSSVLEHATGLAFPRGEGMCTRVPTIVSVEPVRDDKEPSITIASDPTYTKDARTIDPNDTDEFAKAIQNATDKLADEGTIQSTPIYVKYRRNGGPAFTLTDVPGITCISKTQRDVERRTETLTRSMIAQNEDTLVLVVLPATDDFHNSKALKIAEEEDPEGKRTIGVVTKIDNLPPGSDIVDRMTGGEIDLRHGFYAVRNRTQQEINEGDDMDGIDDLEAELFTSDPVLSQLPSSRCGMPELLAKICEEQTRAIDAAIPKLRLQIHEVLVKQEAELVAMPAALSSEGAKNTFFITSLTSVWNDLRRCSEADTTVLGLVTKTTNLTARTHEALEGMTNTLYEAMPDFLDEGVNARLKLACKEALGYDLSNFLQGPVFREEFTKAVFPNFWIASEGAVDRVAAQVRCCVEALFDAHFGVAVVAPAAVKELKKLMKVEIDVRVTKTKMIIGRFCAAEKRCTYTNNHYLAQTIAKMQEIIVHNSGEWKKGAFPGVNDGGRDISEGFMKNMAAEFRAGSNDASAIRNMQVALKAYGKVVHKRFTDSVAVVMLNELVYELIDDTPHLSTKWAPSVLSLLSEQKKVAHRRRELTKSIAGLKTAMAELDSIE